MRRPTSRRRRTPRSQWDDCRNFIVTDYKIEGNRTLADLEIRLRHLDAAFSGWPMPNITEDAIDRFAEDMLAREYKPATVNRCLAVLLRVFKLAKRARKVDRVPDIKRLTERNTRKGFVEMDGMAAIAAELDDDIRPLAWTAYLTGWRKGELLATPWRLVDLKAGWLWLEDSKNTEGRQFPIDAVPELRAILEAQHERKREIERRTGAMVDALFFRKDGRPIRDFRGAWAAACKRAGYPGLIFHDLRRSAVRNFVRAGLPQPLAMALTGHKTASVFRRYLIKDEAMLNEAGQQLAAYLATQRRNTERKVLPIKRKSR